MTVSSETVRIIDVRSPSEYAKGHLPVAVNVPLETIGDRIAGVESAQQIVIVCQGGVRSETACHRVVRSHPNLFKFVGGTNAWKSNGYGVVTGPKEFRSLDRQTHFVA